MKISKAKLRQIIREELNESEYYDDEGDNDASWGQVAAQAAHDLVKDAPVNALLQALRVVSSPMLDATIRKLAYDVVKDLEEIDFNDFVEALQYARDPHGEGF
jgi:hypothetical protein